MPTSTMTRQADTAIPGPVEPAKIGRRLAATGAKVSDAAAAVATAAGDVATRLPGLAERGRAAYDDANRTIRTGSDETLTVGTALSFGFAVGLLVGGARRILVTVALLPVAMLGLTLLDRAARSRSAATSDPKQAGL